MKKALIFIFILTALSCLLAISVSATEWFGNVEIIDGNNDGKSDIVITDMLPDVVAGDETTPSSAEARVKISCNCTSGSHTFPAYYVCTKEDKTCLYRLSYAKLNELLPDYCESAATIDGTKILAFEVPNGFTSNYSGFFYESIGGSLKMAATSLQYFSFAKCSTMTSSAATTSGKNWLQGSPIKELNVGEYMTSIPAWFLYECRSLTTITLPANNSLTTIGEKAFYTCSSLTGTIEFANVTQIGKEAFRYCSTNQGCSLILNFPKVVTLGASSGDTHVFSNSTGIKEIYLGSSLKAMGHNTFTSCTGLEKVQIDAVDPSMTGFPSYTFDGCSSLKAFSIPEGMTTLPQRMFSGCTSLKAVYLPSTLTTINSAAQINATFYNCQQMYFVANPFTFTGDSDIPEKPDVYYFPENLESMSDGEIFKACRGLNETLVFGTKVTTIKNSWAFNAGISNPTLKNIVFLGDVDEISRSNAATFWNFTGKIYFANENDKSTSDVTMNGLSSRVVFCFGENNETHLYERTEITEADCITNSYTKTYCFCGTVISSVENENTKKPHDFENGTKTYTFGATLFKDVTSCTACARNCGISSEVVEEGAVLTDVGYSICTYKEDIAAFTRGFIVNNELLNIYEDQCEASVVIGFAVAAAEGFAQGDDGLTLSDFSVKMVLKAEGAEFEYKTLNFIMTYKSGNYKDELVYVVGYTSVGEEVSFADETLNAVSYNGIAKVPSVQE
ncbi:MAG: leucine-rich repeat domain-containing protein [Ruminococcaceae bacterium]|nr:leucine-rich repeat domain-containing protein [Oscillospiraceae bacterium]